MISNHMFAVCTDELQKLAYADKQHTGLAGVNVRGAGGASPGVKRVVNKGTLQVDKGIRHPFLPHTDPMHSFAGSQTRGMVGKNVAKTQQQAVGDITKSIALRHKAKGQGRIRGTLSRVRSSAAGYRGLKATGEASHQLADISAHYDKPQHLGIHHAGIREKLPKTGYGGGIVGGIEHRRAGMSGMHSRLDDLKPSASRADAQAVTRQARMGSSTARKVQHQLVHEHGFHPAQAAAAHHEFMHSPGFSRTGRVLGEASRDAKYIKGEVGRAGHALGDVAKRLLRRSH